MSDFKAGDKIVFDYKKVTFPLEVTTGMEYIVDDVSNDEKMVYFLDDLGEINSLPASCARKVDADTSPKFGDVVRIKCPPFSSKEKFDMEDVEIYPSTEFEVAGTRDENSDLLCVCTLNDGRRSWIWLSPECLEIVKPR